MTPLESWITVIWIMVAIGTLTYQAYKRARWREDNQ
jgi:hypothetical protein